MNFAESSFRQGRRAILIMVISGLLLWTASVEAARSPITVSPSTTDTIGGTSATIITTWSDEPGCATPPAEAMMTFEQAAALWGTWISSIVPIEAEACWTDSISIPGAAGTGRPTAYVYNPPGAPLLNTHYPVALANALSGVRGGGPEIIVEFNAGYDLSLATALHELAHGLGFVGNVAVEYGIGVCNHSCPTPYDQFVVDSEGVLLLDLQTPDPRVLADRLTSDVSFGGPNTIAANDGQAAKLYTPPAWDYTSLSHLDRDTFQYTQNGLMAPSAVGNHPGPVGLAILHDMGWLRADEVPNVVTTGPQILDAGRAATFDGELVWSAYAGQPVTYTWTADDQSAVTHSTETTTDSATFTWTTPGRRRIILTVTDGVVSVSATRDVLVYGVSVSGLAQADTGDATTFTARVTPEIWTHPITYTWEATHQTTIENANVYDFDNSATFTWHSAGTKTITVTAHIAEATMRDLHLIEIDGPVLDEHIFLPLVVR